MPYDTHILVKKGSEHEIRKHTKKHEDISRYFTEASEHQYLSGHDFCIASGDFHPGVETGSVVSFHDVATIHLIGTDTAIVGSCKS